jgi:hypothetical protein
MADEKEHAENTQKQANFGGNQNENSKKCLPNNEYKRLISN